MWHICANTDSLATFRFITKLTRLERNSTIPWCVSLSRNIGSNMYIGLVWLVGHGFIWLLTFSGLIVLYSQCLWSNINDKKVNWSVINTLKCNKALYARLIRGVCCMYNGRPCNYESFCLMFFFVLLLWILEYFTSFSTCQIFYLFHVLERWHICQCQIAELHFVTLIYEVISDFTLAVNYLMSQLLVAFRKFTPRMAD